MKQLESATELIPAARRLLSFIRSKYKHIPAFCEKTGMDRFKVQKAIKGELLRIDVDFAFDCERATKGAVKAEGWCIDDAARAELKRRRDAEEKPKSGTHG